MAKVTINGEVFEFDGTSTMLTEAMELERGLGCTYGEWQTGLAAGPARSARALCGYIWLVWKRAGRDVALADILAGRPEIDLNGFSVELDGPEPEPGPTAPDAGDRTGPSGSASPKRPAARRRAA